MAGIASAQSLSLRNGAGLTPLMVACAAGNMEVAFELVTLSVARARASVLRTYGVCMGSASAQLR